MQVKEHVRKCHQCITLKAKQQWAPMENILATHFLELVHIDYLCLEPGKGKEENVLVVMDHFTHYFQAYVIQSQMAQTMTKALWDNFIVYYGVLEKILSDQGRNFESELIGDLCKLMGMKKLRTSLYHPQTNGQCDRFNSTLINMLGKLPLECKSDSKGSIGALGHAYNCIQNSTMGFSSYFLMYGRQSQLPITVTLGLTLELITMPTSTKYIQKLREHIRWAHRKADIFQQKEACCNKCNYDKWSNVDYGGFLDGGSGPKDIWCDHSCLTGKTKGQLCIEAL